VNGETLGELYIVVETLTSSLPMAIFSSAPFAAPFSPVIELCIPNAFNNVGVKSLHTKKSYALFVLSCLVLFL